MKNVNALISERLKKGSPTHKMMALADRSAGGNLSSFAGLFSPTELTADEKEKLEGLLTTFSSGDTDIELDLRSLSMITSEVKAINNQAAMLHGERIKRAQVILRTYKEGAFSAWLIATYGNRQTPYNLMQYFEFHEALPLDLKPKLEVMPRQAVYTLASREGPYEKKLEVVENYKGETKEFLLGQIRTLFPLEEKDRRGQNLFETTKNALEKARFALAKAKSLSSKEKDELKEELLHLKNFIDHMKTR